ncbi:hypothetical protein G7Y89_g6257 [Cudoniella acicularis]|uniref:RanBD1 domain-containing protein n=1 Tax=Cudoniella acicularis TaxID=354080 RepID=A0A8H4W315_9HELO|nr:hypothetical protein G7Y89_g6257 [Cudoniella acicularis]
MENTTFDWLDGDYSLNYRTPEVPTSSSPGASQARRPNEPIRRVANVRYHFSDSVVGEGTSNMTRITPCTSTMTIGRRSPNQLVDEHLEGLGDLFTDEAADLKVTIAAASTNTSKANSTADETSRKVSDSSQKGTFGSGLSDKTQTSASAFASSGFASLAAASTSPFGSLGASKPSIFGGTAPPVSGFGALASGKTPSLTSPVSASNTTTTSKDKPATLLSFGGGNSSGFGGLGTGSVFGASLGNGFTGGSGPKLSSFAAPGKENVQLGSKPAKAFGAPESDEDEGSDDDNSEGEGASDDEESGHIASEDKKKAKVTKVPIEDGESGETTLLQLRAKLFALESKEAGWKERGVGTLKINVPTPCASFDENEAPIPGSFDISGLEDEDADSNTSRVPRLIMRQENTHRVILNTVVVRAMEFKDKPSTTSAQILFTAFEGEKELKPINMLFKMSEANAKLFRSEIDSIQHEL